MTTNTASAPRNLRSILTPAQFAEFSRRSFGFGRLSYLVDIHVAANFSHAGRLLAEHGKALREERKENANRFASAVRLPYVEA